MELDIIHNCDALTGLKGLPDESVDCIVTSPPYYGLRDYGVDGQIGLEQSPQEYVSRLTEVFSESRRVLKSNGTLWLNIGDSYAGSGKGFDKLRPQVDSDNCRALPKHWDGIKPKDMIGIPWALAFSLRTEGWFLRQDIIWHKPNPMPESVRDRCTKSYEHLFLLSKSQTYDFDHKAIMEPAAYDGRKDTLFKGSTKYKSRDIYPHDVAQSFAANGHQRWQVIDGQYVRNRRDVWTIPTKPFRGAHFATFPEVLVEPCIKAGCPEGGVVLDPFMGSGTTAVVARKFGRHYIGFELNSEYVAICRSRLGDTLAL